MKTVTASAPGKIVLSGEYAVLHGAPAISMAVNRRARVQAVPAAYSGHALTAPGYCEGRWRFRSEAADIEWLDWPPEPGAFSLLELLWQAARPGRGDWSLSLDSREFVDAADGAKLGVGASAAIAVALAMVLSRIAGRDEDGPGMAAKAHRMFQGGHGSGVDIATSLHGGVIGFRRGEDAVPESLAWPAELHCRVFWSGSSSSTVQKLRTLEGARMSESGRWLQELAEQVLAAWRQADISEVLGALAAYAKGLRAFDVDHDLGIFEAGHLELAEAAEDMGLVYKPCGAGGGDIGAVFAGDAAAVRRFVAMAEGLGFRLLDVALDPVGVRISDE
ncbi:MAG: hypothetical protein WEA08_02330 [Woeseia sp.]